MGESKEPQLNFIDIGKLVRQLDKEILKDDEDSIEKGRYKSLPHRFKRRTRSLIGHIRDIKLVRSSGGIYLLNESVPAYVGDSDIKFGKIFVERGYILYNGEDESDYYESITLHVNRPFELRGKKETPEFKECRISMFLWSTYGEGLTDLFRNDEIKPGWVGYKEHRLDNHIPTEWFLNKDALQQMKQNKVSARYI